MRLLAALVLGLFTAVVQGQPAVSAFTDFPEFEDIRISPKGTYLAYTQKNADTTDLVVVHAANFSVVSKTSFGSETDIQTIDWVNDERILISPALKIDLDFKLPTGEIFGINADGKNFEILFRIRPVPRLRGVATDPFRRIEGRNSNDESGLPRNLGDQPGAVFRPPIMEASEVIPVALRVVERLPGDPEHVIVQAICYDFGDDLNDVALLMDVNNGRLKGLVTSPISNGKFVTGANHDVRFVVGTNLKNVRELYVRTSDDKWDLLFNDEDKAHWVAPFAPYGMDGKMLVEDLGSTGTRGVSIWDPATGQKQDLFHHPVVDVSGLFYDNDRRLWAIEYNDYFPAFFYPDESHPLVALHKRLRATFKDFTVRIVDETDAGDKVIVHVSAPQYPGDFLLMDTQKQAFLMRLPQYPNLPKDALSVVDSIEFKARDGQAIRGYLTIPVATDGRNLPMVVLPHGGPEGIYDDWRYNYETQLLASRGYAVMQVNFRGSSGRGEPFEESGFREWGGRIQDDVTDATRWAISEGVADPDRICIYGAGFGAYSALTGAFREPDLYKCAIGRSGIYDLNLMFTAGNFSGSLQGLSYLKEALGEDRDRRASRSPVKNANRIKANVMLIHGRRDIRAPIKHAERMRATLQKQGKEVTWFSEYGEAEGFHSEENRVKVYEAMLGFLDENIGR